MIDDSSIAAEAIAELFQIISVDQNFLKNNFNLTKEMIREIQEVDHLVSLTMVKINYYYSLVEYHLYENPDCDLQAMTKECYKTVFGYEGEAFHPASELFYIDIPVFFQDYNFALVIRDMIRHTFKMNSPYNNSHAFNQIRKQFMEPNQLYSWQERVEKLCGEPYTFKYLADNLAEKPD